MDIKFVFQMTEYNRLREWGKFSALQYILNSAVNPLQEGFALSYTTLNLKYKIKKLSTCGTDLSSPSVSHAFKTLLNLQIRLSLT